jgi:hypothetical protein
MNKALGLVLIVVGGVLLYQGWSRKESLAGEAAQLSTKVANKVDGGTRVPQYLYYITGGAVLAVAGAGLVLRKAP